jgi:hypothetical protein
MGIGPPNVLSLTVQQGASSLDLSTVTAVNLNVTRQLDGSTATWTCTIDSQSETELACHYPFAVGGADVAVLGIYELATELTIGDTGVVPCYAFRVNGTPPGQTSVRNP